MRNLKVFSIFILVALLFVIGCERKVTEEVIKEIAAGNVAYIGTDACQACHADIHASFVRTGHPYKLNDASEAFTAGYYPFTTLPSSSPELDLSQAMMVIGGFRWKARFIDSSGFIMTGDQVQYNFENDTWTAYHSGETKPYDCGPCHMTDYKDTGNQNDKAGLIGTWAFNGIQCEECHGPGEVHASDPYNVGMNIDGSNEACGKCHIRGGVEQIPASGGFVKHHEQWNEIFQSKHAALDCVDCHNVHESLHPSNPTRDVAIRVDCESCHQNETDSYANSTIGHAGSSVGPTCVDCHMPRAAKSAIANGTYEGDVRSHMFGINTAVDAEMFTPDGAFAIGDLTVEYMCLQCHTTESKAWASSNSVLIHADEIAGIDNCFDCHGDEGYLLQAQGEWVNSVHASGTNVDYTNRGGSDCTQCHNHQGFLEFVETGAVSAPYDNVSAIHCFTCHAPHERGNMTLRTETAFTMADGSTYDHGGGNLCANCHHSRVDAGTIVDDISVSKYWGPHHGPQGDLINSTNGFEFAGYTYSTTNHAGAIEGSCIGCHMGDPRQHSGYGVGGHSFNIEDENGNSISGVCSDCHAGADDIDFLADADYDFDGVIEGYQTEVEGLTDSLRTLLVGMGVLDGTDHPVSGTIADANVAGALWNFLIVHEDRSHGSHNFDYIQGLLASSIEYINTLPAPPKNDLISAHN